MKVTTERTTPREIARAYSAYLVLAFAVAILLPWDVLL